MSNDVPPEGPYPELQECCDENFGDDEKCPYDDYCNPTQSPTQAPYAEIIVTPAPTACEARKWYLQSTKTEIWMCTNGYDVQNFDEGDVYNNKDECCDGVFGTDKCIYVDVCEPTAIPTEPPSLSPTFVSTQGSTPTVSTEKTGPPTKPAQH